MSSLEDAVGEGAHTIEQIAASDAHSAAKKEREARMEQKKRNETKEGHGVRMLYVLVHGNNGQPTDWNFLKERLQRIFGISALVMVSTSNSHSTHDGIEIGGLNLAIEIASAVLEYFKKGVDESAALMYTEFLQSCMAKSSSTGSVARGKKKDKQSSTSLPSIAVAAEEPGDVKDEPKAMESLTKVVGKYGEEVERRRERLGDVAREVKELSVATGQRLAFTIIGHSLGGLYSRNCIAHLTEVGLLGPGRAKESERVENRPQERETRDDSKQAGETPTKKEESQEEEKGIGKTEGCEEVVESVEDSDDCVVEEREASEGSETEEKREQEAESKEHAGGANKSEEAKEGWPLIAAGYMSVTSPHLGSRRPGGTVVRNTWKTLVHAVLNNKNGLTGFELLLEDNTDPENKEQAPLLVRMSDPSGVYLQALRMFSTTTALGITHYDAMVPYCSAAMTAVNPYPTPSRPGFTVVGNSGFEGLHLEQIAMFCLPETKTVTSSVASDSESEQTSDISPRGDTPKVAVKKKNPPKKQSIPLASIVGQACGEGSGGPEESGGSLSNSASSVTNDHSIAAVRGGVEEAMDRKHSHASIVGVRSPNRKTDQYLADTSMAVEFLPEMLKGLQTIPWRRLDVQFPAGPLVHEMPILKQRAAAMMKVFSNLSAGSGCMHLLVHILRLDQDDFWATESCAE